MTAGARRRSRGPAGAPAVLALSLGLAFPFGIPAPAPAYQFLPDEAFRWPEELRPVPFWVANRGDNQMTVFKVVTETRAAFAAWERADEVGIEFLYRGLTNLEPFEFLDDTNTVGYTPTSRMVELGLSRTALAVTGWLTQVETGEIAESDIAVNPGYSWNDNPVRGGWDFRSMMVHEVGHFLGLGHSNVGRAADGELLTGSAIMWPFSFGEGKTTGRTLTADDIAGASVLYPGPAAEGALIRGRVLRPSGLGVSFAHVTAFEPVRNHLVGAWADIGGNFEIRGIPPGRYLLRVNPLPEEHSAADYFLRESEVEIDFRVTILPRLVAVPADGAVEADIEVLREAPR